LGPELAGLIGELDESDRDLLGKALRCRLEGRRAEALTAYRELLARPLSICSLSLLALEAGRLEEELGRLSEALRTYRWLLRRAGVERSAKEAVHRASLTAERLELGAEALKYARMSSLYAQGPDEAFAATVNQLRLGLELGVAVERRRALALVASELVPALTSAAVDVEEGLAVVWLLDLYGEHVRDHRRRPGPRPPPPSRP
jgi:hypothetical protein